MDRTLRKTTVDRFRIILAVYHNSNRKGRGEIRDKVAESRIETFFDISKATAKVSPKSLKADDQDSVRKARRSLVE